MQIENEPSKNPQSNINSYSLSLQIWLWDAFSLLREQYNSKVVEEIRNSLEKRDIIQVKFNDTEINAVSQCYSDIQLIANRDKIELSNLDLIKAAILAHFVREDNEIMRQIPQLISEVESYLRLAESYLEHLKTDPQGAPQPPTDFRLSQEALDIIYSMSLEIREYQPFVVENFIVPFSIQSSSPAEIKRVEPNLDGYAHSFSNTSALLTLGGLMRVYFLTPENPIHLQRIKDYHIFLQYYKSGFDIIGGSLEVVSEISPLVAYLALESVKSPFRNFELLEALLGFDIPAQKKHLEEMYAKLVTRVDQIPDVIPQVAVTQLMAKIYNILAEVIRNAVKYCAPNGISFDLQIGKEPNCQTLNEELQLVITVTNNQTEVSKQSFSSTKQGEKILNTLVTEINVIIPNMINVESPTSPASDPYVVVITIAV